MLNFFDSHFIVAMAMTCASFIGAYVAACWLPNRISPWKRILVFFVPLEILTIIFISAEISHNLFLYKLFEILVCLVLLGLCFWVFIGLPALILGDAFPTHFTKFKALLVWTLLLGSLFTMLIHGIATGQKWVGDFINFVGVKILKIT